METTRIATSDAASRRLASEIADVRASIRLVSSGVATNVTLTGLRFGREIAAALAEPASAASVSLQAEFRPDDSVGDLRVSARLVEGRPRLHG